MKQGSRAWVLGGLSVVVLAAIAQACASSTASGIDGGADSGIPVTKFDTGTGSEGSILMLGSGSGSSLGTGTGTGSADAGKDAPEGDTSTGTGSGSEAGHDGAIQTDAGSGSDTGTTTDAGKHDAASDDASGCDKPPTGPYAEHEAGVYCPFSAADSGDNKTCTPGQHCCEPATGTSTCVASATMCAANDTNWECEGPLDCANVTGAHICCGTGTIHTQEACGSYPTYPYVEGFTAATCAATCTTFVICSQTSDCKVAGETCVGLKPKGNQIGYCASADAGAADAH